MHGLSFLSAMLLVSGTMGLTVYAADDAIWVPATVGGGERGWHECQPEGLLYGQAVGPCGTTQWYWYAELEFHNPSDPNLAARVRCDNFPPPGAMCDGPIRQVVWQGLYVDYSSEGCDKPAHLFRIRFYEDENGAPGDPETGFYTEYVEAEAEPTGDLTVIVPYAPAVMVWRFTAELSQVVPLSAGWISVVGYGTPGCFHLMAGSNEGDNKFYEWWEPGGQIPGTPRTGYCDLHLCLSAGVRGACCFDCGAPPGNCIEDMVADDCVALGGRSGILQSCAQLSPPCGVALGACCRDDGACDVLMCAECGPFPNVWFGAGTICDQCCQIAVTEPTEGEPSCYDNYLDEFNRGCEAYPCGLCCRGDCNCDDYIGFGDIDAFVDALAGFIPCEFYNCDINRDGRIDFDDINPFVERLANHSGPCPILPPLFRPIPVGVPAYGRSGTFLMHGDLERDSDWYEVITAGEPTIFTLRVRAEFDVEARIIAGGNCDPNAPNAYWVVDSRSAAACSGTHDPNELVADLTTTTHCVPAGQYWFVVRPSDMTGVPCGADYWIWLDSPATCTPCDIDGGVSTHPEVEACGADTNGGCNVLPPVFEDVGTLEPDNPTVICGTVWANHGARDTDWYQWQVSKTAQIRWEVSTEIPLRVTTAAGSCADLDGYWALPIVPACSSDPNYTTFTTWNYYLRNRPCWFVVLPEDGDGPLLEGYPCSLGQSEYRVTLTAVPIQCPHLCGSAIPEGEPPCGPDYVDTFNGGCDAATFHATNVVLGTTGHCGRLGTFTVGGQPTRDHDWWKVTLTGTANARLKIGLRSEVNLNLELYGGLDPNNPNCAARMMLDWYRIDACEATASVYTPCLLNTMGGGTGVYYIRIYTTESGVSCTATAGNTYKLTVALDQSGCTLCALNCTGGLDDPCQDDPSDPETNDPCNDPNVPGNAMSYPSGNYPQYGAKQCGRISTFAGAGDSPWVDRDFFAFTMPAGKTKLYVRARAQFRMTLRLFDTSCTPIIDTSGVQRMAAWDRACSLVSVRSIEGLTPGTVYWGEVVYGNGKTGSGLQEWFEGLPCPGQPYSAGYNIYEVELAGGV